MSTPLTLHSACLINAIQNHLTPGQYKYLAEWLGCYEYVLPDAREILPELMHSLATKVVSHRLTPLTPSAFYSLWATSDILFCGASAATQKEILAWTLDLNNSVTAAQ